ncbi:MAG: TolC family protein, partial [Candidatus Acidiferrales bacterium]
EQEAAQNKAVESSKRTFDISTSRYKEGLANFLEVIDAERTVLANSQESAQLRELRLLTTVQFIKALGGGWQESKIYSDSQAPANSSQPSH